MSFKLSGKRVLVTGASRGIGLGIAKGFYHEGCSVVSNGRNEFDFDLFDRKKKGMDWRYWRRNGPQYGV